MSTTKQNEKTMRKLSMDELNRLSKEDFVKAEKLPIIIILDNIRSLSNVGAFFRTADAFRIGELVLCGITACPPHREIHKTALGADETVKWRYFSTTASPFNPSLLSSTPLMSWATRWKASAMRPCPIAKVPLSCHKKAQNTPSMCRFVPELSCGKPSINSN